MARRGGLGISIEGGGRDFRLDRKAEIDCLACSGGLIWFLIDRANLKRFMHLFEIELLMSERHRHRHRSREDVERPFFSFSSDQRRGLYILSPGLID